MVELRATFSAIKTIKDRLEPENICLRQETKMKHRHGHIIGQSDGLKGIPFNYPANENTRKSKGGIVIKMEKRSGDP